MSKVFLILGYGIPKDITKDSNYQTYLACVFNYIYEHAKFEHCDIITSGGKTDIYKPYRRTEAVEMAKVIKSLSSRKFVKQATLLWKFYTETKSLSSLENLLFVKKLIEQKNIQTNEVVILCEHTRERRINVTAKKIFGANAKVKTFDFDLSSNRYLDPKFIKQKEEAILKHSLWALQSNDNLKRHHQLFAEKVRRFREVGPRGHQEEIRLWWEEKMEKLSKSSN